MYQLDHDDNLQKVRRLSPALAHLPAGSSLIRKTCTFQMLADRDQLPVKEFEDEILSTIDSNPVVLIRGATGCGKTTQVPQFILDRFIKGGRASDCNIVVTQVALMLALTPVSCSDPNGGGVCSPEGSVLSPWLNESPTREERIRARAAATASASSPSFLAPTPASSSAPWVRLSASIFFSAPQQSGITHENRFGCRFN